MTAPARKREVGRGERLLPGFGRLRLPLPWPGVPHCNAWAVAAGDGIVLFDTGMHEPGSPAHLERALGQVNLNLDLVRLVVCTHAHSDHYGQAGPIVDRAGCELWMDPDYDHAAPQATDPPPPPGPGPRPRAGGGGGGAARGGRARRAAGRVRRAASRSELRHRARGR